MILLDNIQWKLKIYYFRYNTNHYYWQILHYVIRYVSDYRTEALGRDSNA